jgi:respiratory-subunit NADH dehydrogenase subunit
MTGDVPVFVVVGGGARSDMHRLRTAPGINVMASPRHASVLLVAGSLAEDAAEFVRHVHDQMAGPRVTVGWNHPEPPVIPLAENATGDVAEAVATIRRLFQDVLTGEISPEPPLLPNVDAVEWRGVGPYGHGGTGMTGGTPFGRPLPLRAPSRDNLELDQLPVTIGPWFDGFPSGLALRVSLQGDVVQAVEVSESRFVPQGSGGVFERALREPTPIRDLEMARAQHHLEWIADALRLSGVDRLAVKAGRLAQAIKPGDTGHVEKLAAAIRRSLLRSMTLRDVGVLPTEIDLAGLGPVARAAGSREDLRAAEDGYDDLGFQPVTHDAGDAWARFMQRVNETTQAVDLAGRAGNRLAFGNGAVEAPDGVRHIVGQSPSDRFLAMFESILVGAEWGDLIATIHSFDIDMESVSVDEAAQ